MFNSTILEVAIGLVFCYASVALIASSIYEALASWLDLRSKTLLAGIKNLLNAHDAVGNDLLLKIYNHALVHPTGNGAATSLGELKNNPSYIDSRHFAIALIDAIQSASDDRAKLGAKIDAIPNVQLRQLLRGMHDRTAGDAQRLHDDLAMWFDAAMDRVSGSYKRQSQTWCFVIALVFAAAFNVDSVHLFSTLWQHSSLVAKLSIPGATLDPADALHNLYELPIGWRPESDLFGFECFTIFGWLITASAALFGAPFWFDLLQQLIRLRGTGQRPNPFSAAHHDASDTPASATPPSATLTMERNAIVDLHAERNKDDESYRPIQPGERW